MWSVRIGAFGRRIYGGSFSKRFRVCRTNPDGKRAFAGNEQAAGGEAYYSPQAISISVPAFVANIIFLLKETSVFSAISLMDLMFTAKDLIGLYYKTTECLVLLVIFYLIILLPVSLIGSIVERKVRYAGFGV